MAPEKAPTLYKTVSSGLSRRDVSARGRAAAAKIQIDTGDVGRVLVNKHGHQHD